MTQTPDHDRSQRHAISSTDTSSANGRHRTIYTSASWPTERIGRSVRPAVRIRTLLVPLDGSSAAEHALPYALSIARRTGATVRLVHVWSAKVKPWHNDERIERLTREKQAYLDSVVCRIRSKHKTDLVTLVIESRHIAKSLREAAADVTLVVMAAGQRGVARRLLRRSVTNALMRTLPCPLLLVRSHTSVVDLASDPVPQHVLVPLDSTTSAETAIEFAAALGGLSGARFTLTHFQTLEQTLCSCKGTDSHGYLRGVAERFSKRLPQIRTEVLIDDQDVATAVLSRVENTGIDLIALTKSKRTGLAQLLNLSVADAVVRKASTPVLVLHSTFPRAKSRECSANRSFWNWRRATAAFVNA